MIRNAAHDSICACSHDEVVDAVLHRYAEATRTAEGIAVRAVEAAGSRMGTAGAVAVNPTARPRTDMVELDVPGPYPGEPDDDARFQVLQRAPAVEELGTVPAADAPLVLVTTLMGEHPGTAAVRLEDDDGVLVAHLLSERAEGALSTGEALAVVGRRCAAEPDLMVRMVLHRSDPFRRVLALAGPVPPFGWSRWAPVDPRHPVRPAGGNGVTNGLVTVEVDPADGTFSLDGVPGYGRLVDDGDAGDTYNWCPPEDDVVVDTPLTVLVRRTETGPVRGTIVVESMYVLPERCEIEGREDMTTDWAGGERYRRVGQVFQLVTTTLEVRADEPFVRVTTAWTSGPGTTGSGSTCRSRSGPSSARRRTPTPRSAGPCGPRAAPTSGACRRSRPVASCGPAG